MKKNTQKSLVLIVTLFFFGFVSNMTIHADSIPENIEYWVTPKVVHIKNDSLLKDYLQSEDEGTKDLVLESKKLYLNTYDSEIQVNNRSMYVEIIGHVFPDTVADYLPEWLASTIKKHTSIIDSGEASVDSNRWIWDSIAFVIEDFQSPVSTQRITGSTEKTVDSIYAKYHDELGIELDKTIMQKVVSDLENNEISPLLIKEYVNK